MLKIIPLAAAAILALSVPLIAQDAGPVLRIIEAEDQIIQIRARTRHTTVIVLPATETVLDFVVGDSEYWHLTRMGHQSGNRLVFGYEKRIAASSESWSR